MDIPLKAAARLQLRLVAKRFNDAALAFAGACGKVAKKFERFAKADAAEENGE
jgi:hypothetical protein